MNSHSNPPPSILTNLSHHWLRFYHTPWFVFTVTTLISFLVYLITLAPSVTLEDSGEFITAAHYLGVPHPPGYPSWTIFGWFFSHIPYGNIAWRINLSSAVYGALAIGILSTVTFSSGRVVLSRVLHKLDAKGRLFMATAIRYSSIAAGLILAFTDVMWSQAVIAEVYTLNALFLALMLYFLYKWTQHPEKYYFLYALAFCFGLGLTNHQTILFAFPAILVAVFLVDRKFFPYFFLFSVLISASGLVVFCYYSSDWVLLTICFALLFLALLMLIGVLIALRFFEGFFADMLDEETTLPPLTPEKVETKSTPFIFDPVYFAIIVGSLALFLLHVTYVNKFDLTLRFSSPPMNSPEFQGLIEAALKFKTTVALWIIGFLVAVSLGLYALKDRKHHVVATLFISGWLGLLVYGYIHYSSATNPPMNWGYGSIQEGFFHAINRGQYENNLANTIKGVAGWTTFTKSPANPIAKKNTSIQKLNEFSLRVGLYLRDLTKNFSFLLCLFAVVPLFFIFKIDRKGMYWLVFLIFNFALLSFVLMAMLGGDTDRQTIWVNKVFFLQSHCIFGMFIGYGLMYAFYLILVNELEFIHPALAVSLAALPAYYNWSTAEQKGHDFGWQYGYDMLINCDKDAVFYGGTDPGRFVPTYMIFSESFQNPKWKMDKIARNPREKEFDRRDLYIITQNALADDTYMSYIRDHYGYQRPANDRPLQKLLGRDKMYPKKPIWIPEAKDGKEAFKSYVQLYQQNPAMAPGIIVSPDGRVSIVGIEGVFAINGILAQWIWEKNKHSHSFYVEESFPLGWMYPYLEPFGLCMKINKDPLKEITPEMVERDMNYWNEYTNKLLGDPLFQRDEVAKKAFSKLRVSIAGLYQYRKMYKEADYAYRQSLELCPFSTESAFRYCDMLTKQEKFQLAIQVLQETKKHDPENRKIDENIAMTIRQSQLAQRQGELLKAIENNKSDWNSYRELVGIYYQRGRVDLMDATIRDLIGRSDFPLQSYLELAKQYEEMRNITMVFEILNALTKRDPKNPGVWYNLAVIHSAMLNGEKALDALERAISIGGLPFAQQAASDGRFNNIRAFSRFQEILKGGEKTTPNPSTPPPPAKVTPRR